MRKFNKLHSYMKYCPNCDQYSRLISLEDHFYCHSCEQQWELEQVIADYEKLE